MRVALLVTGKLEYLGLTPALRQLFPEHEFECVSRLPSPEQQCFNGFTSTPLPIEPIPGVRSTADVLVEAAAGRACGDRAYPAHDLVVILDDLELANHHQPAVVVQHFATRVLAHIEQLPAQQRDATRVLMRERVSLHFAVPMVESWLFGDPAALARAGVPVDRTPLLGCGAALEDFQTSDAAYHGDDCSACAVWQQLRGRRLTKNKRRANEPEWCRGTDAAATRPRHPKRYLAWLCRNHAVKKCSDYSETDAAPALGALDWQRLFSAYTLPYLFALLDDLADGLGEGSPLPEAAVLAELTRRRRGGVLRNCGVPTTH